MPDAPQSDWRDTGSTPANAGPAKPWQADAQPGAASSTLPSRRNMKRAVAVVALLGLAIGMGVVVYWLRPIKPACLVLIGAGYETNLLLPHNVYGWNGLHLLEKEVAQEEDLANLLRFSWSQPTKIRRVGKNPVELAEANWPKIWDKIDIASYKEPTVLLFISMHGMADAKDAYLLPNVPGKQFLESFESARIPFRDVLESLKAVKNKKIVLLLDVCHAETFAPIGMLHNDFAARLKSVYEKEIEAIPNLSVICSTDADQQSWGSEELQTTAFAYYVTQGLKGADHGPSSNVNALSLFKYVRENVNTWAQTNRARRQTPILLGGESRANDIKLVHIAEAYTAPETTAAELDVEALGQEWEKWRALKTGKTPQAHNPHVWRLYQDLLLRYEQLVRAGDPTRKADEVKTTLAALHAEISASRSLAGAYACLGNNFPIHRVLGFSPPADLGDSALRAFLSDLRKYDGKGEGDEDKNKTLERFRDKSQLEKQYLQVRLSRMLLQNLQAERDRDKIARRLAEIESELKLARPVEAQLFKMMDDADRGVPEATVQAALDVRALAEEVALSVPSNPAAESTELYAEVIFPFIKSDVESADRLRRAGEDLLFGDPKTHAPKAEEKLREARAHYEKARGTAERLQRALAARDDASAELPYFAIWLATNPLLSDKQAEEARLAVDKLGTGLAALNRALDGADRKMAPPVTLVTQVESNLQRLRDQLQDACVTLKTLAPQQRNWHAVDGALRVPPSAARDDVTLRKTLLRKERDISSKLLANPNPEGKSDIGSSVPQRVKLRHDLLRACLQSVEDLGDQPDGSVNERARDLFLRLPRLTLAKAELAAGEGPDLETAVLWCRTMPGGIADFVRDDPKKRVNPAERLRKVRLHGLLHWLAERTLADHWFEPGPRKEDPYYDRAGKAYLGSARGLFDDEQIPDALLRNAERVKNLFTPAELQVDKIGPLLWTTETEFKVDYQVRADQGLPEGTPMIWMEVGSGKATQKAWPRAPMSAWPTVVGVFPLEGIAYDAAVTVNLHAYYRGQHVRQSAQSVRVRADVIARHAPGPANDTAIAVRMDSKFDYGAISIVLDTSGSMVEKDGTPLRRFDYALKALEQVLGKVPENTGLSIFTFGDPNNNNRPTRYRAPAPWRHEEFGNLKKELTEIPLKGGSPIAETVIKSMKEGFRDGFKGPKAIMVLTDGDDSTSFAAEAGDRTARIVNELKAANAKSPDIVVVMVCFIDKKLNETAYNSAQNQFGCVETFHRPGRFLDEPEGEKLGDVIEDLVRPCLQLLALATGEAAPGFKDGVAVSYPSDQALKWEKAAPNLYHAHVLRTAPNPKVNVQMTPGQRLFLTLHRTDERLSLKRALLALQPETEKRGEWRREREGWLVSLLQNQSIGLNPVLKQLVVFEKKADDKDRVRQPVPAMAWLELDARDGAKPDQTLRWWRDWSVPAPALRVEMPEWPTRSQPKITAWFWPDERAPFLANRSLAVRAARPVPFRDTSAAQAEAPAIESVAWGVRDIETDKGGKLKKDCLIVRVRHAKGQPVWIDLENRPAGVGSENHFFFEAQSTTAYFYDLPRPQTAELILVDLPAFKTAAQRVEFSPDVRIDLPDLFVPKKARQY